MKIFNAAQTAELLSIPALINALREAVPQYAQGEILSPERMVVPMQEGGVMLSMPATAEDIAVHKLVNVNPRNAKNGLPTIHGQVVACDALSGEMLFQVDGPTVTAKRTAAVTLLAIDTFTQATPARIMVIGDGKQAGNHVEAIAEVYPDADILVRGYSDASTQAFVERLKAVAPRLRVAGAGEDADVVITLTTSKTPVFAAPARAGRLVIGVGAFTPDAAEIHPDVVHASQLFADDPHGAKAEAGDLIQAKVNWNEVGSLASGLSSKPDFTRPILFKSVGTGAWDLAACRLIRAALAA